MSPTVTIGSRDMQPEKVQSQFPSNLIKVLLAELKRHKGEKRDSDIHKSIDYKRMKKRPWFCLCSRGLRFNFSLK